MDQNRPYFTDQTDLGKRGIFYVGGHISGPEGRHHMCNQMFVEAYIPKTIRHPYPLILFHGAGQTNVNWLMTPDGRMGWADYFVSQGYCVYLVEQPARGRSAYHPEENGPRIYHSMEAISKRFASDEGGWPQAPLHTQWPGQGKEADPSFIQFLSSQVEYLPQNKDSQQLVLDAGLKLLEQTGPAVLLTHSQAGPFGWLLADAAPDLVRGIVALEPSGPPFSRDLTCCTAQNYGIADLPLQFEPPINDPRDFKLSILKAPKKDLSDGWVLSEPAPKLTRLQNIPIALVVSEASYHAQYDHLTSYVLKQCGVAHDFIRLEDAGIHGNGHMMMLEQNNLEIASFLANWIQENVH